MKNSNEWIQDIKEKADARFAEQKRRRKIIAGVSSSAACLALILCSALMLPNTFDSGLTIGVDSSGTTQTLDNSTTPQHPGSSDSQIGAAEPSEEQPDNPPAPGPSSESPKPDNPTSTPGTEPEQPNITPLDFTVNNIIGQMSGAKPYRDPAEHYTETWSAQQMVGYLGVDLAQLSTYLPKDLAYVKRDGFTVTYHNDGNIVEDFASFSYTGTDRRTLTVLASKVGTPYDAVYSLETDNTERIGGVEVLIGGMSKDGTSNDYDFFYADFEADGINYRVKADNLTGEEFYKAVEGIIGLK